MPDATRKRELGRGERVVPGVHRLRLPLPWKGVPHCNAWAVAAGDGVVLFDVGVHEPGSLAQLERAMDQVGLKLDHVRLVVCTHPHADHYGQVAPVLERSGAGLAMDPRLDWVADALEDPDAWLMRRAEVGRHSGVPTEAVERWLEERRADGGKLIAELVEPTRPLVPGDSISTDLGEWVAVETPGHCPGHLSFHQPERRLLISGDHLLGRVSLYFEFGPSPDPVGEFLESLDRVDALDVRLCLPGHGRPFTDVHGHVEANRALVRQRLHAVRTRLAAGPETPYELCRGVYGEGFNALTATWLMTKTLAYLRHLAVLGEAEQLDGEPERWQLVADPAA